MKTTVLFATLAVLSPGALFAQFNVNLHNQSPAVAKATNTLTNKTKVTVKPPAKKTTKPTTPSKPTTGTGTPTTPKPAKPKPANTNTNTSSNQNANSNANANSNNLQNVSQAQGGAGGQGGSGTGVSASKAEGGSATGGSSASGSTANGTVDASNHSVSNSSSTALFLPPVVPETPPSTLAASSAAIETTACGPLQVVVHHPIYGTYFGLFKKSKVELGVTDDLAPYTGPDGLPQAYHQIPDGQGGFILIGDQATYITAVLGVAGARNIALGGGGNTSWGQAGMGTSASIQQLAVKIILHECEAARIAPPAPPTVPDTGYSSVPVAPPTADAPPEKVIYVEPKHIRE